MIESVISLLTRNGDLSVQERKFLNDACKRLHVPKKRRDDALILAKQGKGRLCLPENDADKNRLIYLLVQAIVVNGEILPEKRIILDELVDMLGISRQYTENFLQTRLREIQEENASKAPLNNTMTCPKCGHVQITAYKCKRCGIIFSRYKHHSTSSSSDADALTALLASSNRIQEKTS